MKKYIYAVSYDFDNISAIQVFTRIDSRSPSPVLLDEADTANSNTQATRLYSDDENLETIGRKVSAIINGNTFLDIRPSENGNIFSEAEEIVGKRR